MRILRANDALGVNSDDLTVSKFLSLDLYTKNDSSEIIDFAEVITDCFAISKAFLASY